MCKERNNRLDIKHPPYIRRLGVQIGNVTIMLLSFELDLDQRQQPSRNTAVESRFITARDSPLCICVGVEKMER